MCLCSFTKLRCVCWYSSCRHRKLSMNKLLVFGALFVFVCFAQIPQTSAQSSILRYLMFLFASRPRNPAPPACPRCDRMATCIRSGDGRSVYCECKSGYTGDGFTCEQVKQECNCNDFADCVLDHNDVPSCRCREGFTGDGRTCTVDGPLILPCVCDENALCTFDTAGFPSCACNEGYTGDGFVCAPVGRLNLPCVCDENAICTFNEGGFPSCTCDDGYTGDGFVCAPTGKLVLPCVCDENAICTFDDLGLPSCACKEGYSGDGFTCFVAVSQDTNCPGNQFYSTCAGCTKRCDERDQVTACATVCRQQCTCPVETYLNGDNCVTADQCPSPVPTTAPTEPPIPTCPGNQFYSTCARCTIRCDQRNLLIKPCSATCREQCTCPTGTFINGDNCVTADQCPQQLHPSTLSRCNPPCPPGQRCTRFFFSYSCRP